MWRPAGRPLTSSPVPRRLVSSSTSPGRAPPLRSRRSGWPTPMTARPYLGSGSRIVCPPASVPPASRTFADGPLEDPRHDVPWQVFGERRDRQREQDAATHREDVTQRVRGRDLAECPRVVDERREEVERADDRELVGEPVGGGVIGRRAARRSRRPAMPRPRVRSAPRPAGRRRAWRRSRRSRSASSIGRRGVGPASSPVDDRLPAAVTGRVRAERITIAPGMDGPRWVPRSSKSVARRSAWRGGFDSHAFPPRRPDVVETGRHVLVRRASSAVLRRLRPSVDGSRRPGADGGRPGASSTRSGRGSPTARAAPDGGRRWPTRRGAGSQAFDATRAARASSTRPA